MPRSAGARRCWPQIEAIAAPARRADRHHRARRRRQPAPAAASRRPATTPRGTAAQAAFEEMLDAAIALGGTVTGEHGVGLLKRGGHAPRARPAVARHAAGGQARARPARTSSTPARCSEPTPTAGRRDPGLADPALTCIGLLCNIGCVSQSIAERPTLEELSAELVLYTGRLVRADHPAGDRAVAPSVPTASLRLLSQVDELGPGHHRRAGHRGPLLAADDVAPACRRSCERGWAAKQPNPADARSSLVTLTDAGRTVLGEARARARRRRRRPAPRRPAARRAGPRHGRRRAPGPARPARHRPAHRQKEPREHPHHAPHARDARPRPGARRSSSSPAPSGRSRSPA